MNKAKLTANQGEPLIHIERVLNGTPEKVFKALTTKELIEKWWVGPGYTITAEELDPRAGGTWKYVQTTDDGHKAAFFGVYHEVSPERVIQTFEFDGLPERGHVILEKMELHATEDGKTRINITQSFLSVADRDGLLASGMEEGMQNTYNKLDDVLASM